MPARNPPDHLEKRHFHQSSRHRTSVVLMTSGRLVSTFDPTLLAKAVPRTTLYTPLKTREADLIHATIKTTEDVRDIRLIDPFLTIPTKMTKIM